MQKSHPCINIGPGAMGVAHLCITIRLQSPSFAKYQSLQPLDKTLRYALCVKGANGNHDFLSPDIQVNIACLWKMSVWPK